MANSSRAHGAKLSNAKVIRRQRRGKRYLYKMAMYAIAGILFVAIAGLLVLLSRGGGMHSSDATPLSGSAPNFTLPAVSGGEISLASYRGEKNVLLFFNEGYGCAPCWQQAQDIQKRTSDLDAAHTEFLDIMVDPPGLLKSEVSRWGLKMPVLSDTDRTVSQEYNTLGFGMHADKPNHTFVFVDKDGQIRWWEDYASMRAPTDDVIKKVQALTAGGS